MYIRSALPSKVNKYRHNATLVSDILVHNYLTEVAYRTMTSLQAHKLMNLTGRIALVTGGGTGIGLMIAQGLAANGAKVYITGRRLAVLQSVADAWDKTVGGEIIP